MRTRYFVVERGGAPVALYRVTAERSEVINRRDHTWQPGERGFDYALRGELGAAEISEADARKVAAALGADKAFPKVMTA